MSLPSAIGAATLLRLFIPFACGYFLSYLYRVVNAVIALDLCADLGLDPARLGLLTSAYFLTFAAAQLPLGVALDRFGPRRVEAALLLFAAAGAWLFAGAGSLAGLVAGRALIGFGVSACLMAAFTAYAGWIPAPRLPLVNGWQMAAGGMGALSATAPVEWALQFTDWRGLFQVLALLTLAVATAIFLLVPDRERDGADLKLTEQLQGIREVFTSPLFWSIAPWTVASQATYLSIQGLWVGPWLRDVASLERSAAASTLLFIAAAMVAGFLTMGSATERLGRRGVRPIRVATCGMGAFMLVQLGVLAFGSRLPTPLWMLFGFFGTTGILPYAILSQSFPRRLAGRANTGLNLLVFVAAFAAQWGIGAVIGLWPALAGGGYHPAGYRAAFILMLMLQLSGCAWYLWAARRLP
ncbi:MFS transporter [Desulfuromonas versatilis]|uniref:MFS transporter n=1 Tax=Desulfuromonas versatilis TaxID=2802975 RepID=A0ABM8HQU8_9BACT|nr:MFS transporter [Desulfuromonas versatilis]BCR03260.1 MFS transporter [Desulfuromonas versatilis]